MVVHKRVSASAKGVGLSAGACNNTNVGTRMAVHKRVGASAKGVGSSAGACKNTNVGTSVVVHKRVGASAKVVGATAKEVQVRARTRMLAQVWRHTSVWVQVGYAA